MNLHEFQGKQLFREYGLPVSKGFAVTSASDAVKAAKKIGGTKWAVSYTHLTLPTKCSV